MTATPEDDSPIILVSADSHVGPRLREDLRDYCPSDLLDDLDRTIAQLEAHPANWTMRDALGAEMAAKLERRNETYAWNRQTDGHHDFAARRADMDRDGVACEIIFHGSQNGQPMPFLGGAFANSQERSGRWVEHARVGAAMYNRWLADRCAEDPVRHLGLAQVVFADLEQAARDIRAAAELGLRGVNFPAPRAGIPGFDDPSWHPVFAACVETGMLLNTHIGGAPPLADPQIRSAEIAIPIVAMELAWVGRRGLWHLVFAGVFERYPELKYVLTEVTGDWWTPHAVEMDSIYRDPIAGIDLQRLMPRPPSSYMATNVWFGASFPSHSEAVSAVEGGYAKRVQWGADYPHAEGAWHYSEDPGAPSVVRLSLAHTFHGLPLTDVRDMVGGATIECYDLDRVALQAIADRIGPTPAELGSKPDLSVLPDRYQGLAFRADGALYGVDRPAVPAS
jgi:predicted TIM-barrel fold metal-dependent hydrolase